MDRRRRRLIAYVGSIVIIVFVYGFVYYWGMRLFEHRPRSFLHSLQVVIQTFTTVGFGGDAPWQSPTMKILMIMMEVTGIFLVFLALPLFVVPALEDRLTVTPPTSIDENNHVIICGFGTRGEMLVDELESVGVRYVIIEQDRDSAKDLYEQGYSVMHGDPESISALEDADIESATAIVLNNGDESNAAIALAVRERDPDIQTVCYLEDPQFQDYLEYAGVDTILLPHQMIGESLAEKVTSSITARLGDTIKVGEDFQVVEMPVQQESTLEGMSLRESNIRKRTGADIIGIWKGDNFIINPSPNEIITKKSTLLATGT
ncbi:MAG: TrkA family potassium uptake protein, partial [Halobacteriaceae archaeon]